MTSYLFDSQKSISPAYRAIFGVLLSLIGIVSFGWALRTLPPGDYRRGIVGLTVTFGAFYWIFSMFAEGYRDN